MRKPYQSPGQDEKLTLLYCGVCDNVASNAALHSKKKKKKKVGDWTRDLPHTVASNMVKYPIYPRTINSVESIADSYVYTKLPQSMPYPSDCSHSYLPRLNDHQ